MPLITPPIKNIKEVTEPLKEEILKGNVHTIEEMKAWLQAFGYSDAIKDATINAMPIVSRLDQRSTSDRRWARIYSETFLLVPLTMSQTPDIWEFDY